MTTKSVVIGLSGTNGSGKDVIGHLLADSHGFLFVDATEMLAAELKKRGLPTDRVHKSSLSAEWRRAHGMAVIVDKALELLHAGSYKGLVVGSLRHPGEVDRVHQLGGTVVWVDADPAVRYKRITAHDRGRIEDQKTFEQWTADEHREMYPEGDAATLNGAAVKERADIFIENNGNDLQLFRKQVEEALNTIL